MNTNDFIQLLPVTIDRATVLGQLRNQTLDMTDNLIPAYQQAGELLGDDYESKSQTGRNIARAFSLRRMGGKRVMWYNDVQRALENAASLMATFTSDVEKLKTSIIARDGISLRLANVLQLAEMNNFMTSYAPKLLLWYYAQENAASNSHINGDALPPDERKWITENLMGFAAVVDLYLTSPDEFLRKLNSVTTLPASGIDYATAMATTPAKVDPLKLNFIGEDLLVGMISGISYRLGKLWVEWSVKKHLERKELRTALELRLLEMKMVRDGTMDASLSKRIKMTEDRLSKLSRQIAEYEG